MYQPNSGKGIAVADVPAPLPSKGSDAIYCYENLPSEHWKKYLYAARLVNVKFIILRRTKLIMHHVSFCKVCKSSESKDTKSDFVQYPCQVPFDGKRS